MKGQGGPFKFHKFMKPHGGGHVKESAWRLVSRPDRIRMDLIPQPFIAAPSRRLATEVERRLRDARRTGATGIERVEVAVELYDPLAWLRAQPLQPKVYWHGRSATESYACVGTADQILGSAESVLRTLERQAEGLRPAARYFGGLRFASRAEGAPEWGAFAPARFVLPRLELRIADGHATLAANLVFPRDARRAARVLDEIAAVRWPEGTEPDLPLPTARADVPDRETWRRGIESALEAFESTSLEKVVLARRASYAFNEPLDPFVLLQRLEAATPSCFHFLIQPRPGVAFLGASPERLFRRKGRRLWSEAVAGTRPRGASAASDAELRDELLLSDKDQREHGYVRDNIRCVLTPLCERIDVDAEVSDLPLARGRHLYSAISAVLRPDVTSSDVLRALHPTPAVGGTPTPEALDRIEATEPFGRGWYAGPVGWVGANAAEFAVGIRSGLVQQHEEGATLSLYSGAGIVRGSEPEAEWREIEQKIGNFARVLGLDP